MAREYTHPQSIGTAGFECGHLPVHAGEKGGFAVLGRVGKVEGFEGFAPAVIKGQGANHDLFPALLTGLRAGAVIPQSDHGGLLRGRHRLITPVWLPAQRP